MLPRFSDFTMLCNTRLLISPCCAIQELIISSCYACYSIVFSGVLWPYPIISVAPIDNTSLVCDPEWVSYALKQAERFISHARAIKVVHNFAWNLLYDKVLHTFAWNTLYCIDWKRIKKEKKQKKTFFAKIFEKFFFDLIINKTITTQHNFWTHYFSHSPKYHPHHHQMFVFQMTLQLNTAQYNSIQLNTTQYNSIQLNTAQYNSIQLQ